MILNLGCGEDHHHDAVNVDVVSSVNPDEVVDLNQTPWPWDNDSVSEIRAYHVFEHFEDIEAALRESARLLETGGTLELRLPMGNDAIADPDHNWGKSGNPWAYRTPEFYCGKRHWDVDVGLRVKERSVEMWALNPGLIDKAIRQAFWRFDLWQRGPSEWCFSVPQMSGEFTVVFEKP